MPDLTHEQAIQQYYETIKDKYPNLSYEEVYNLCHSPFKSIITYMRDERLPHIFIKHLGKFKVFPSKIKDLIKAFQVFYDKGYHTKEKYEKIQEFLAKRLKDLEQEEIEVEVELINE